MSMGLPGIVTLAMCIVGTYIMRIGLQGILCSKHRGIVKRHNCYFPGRIGH